MRPPGEGFIASCHLGRVNDLLEAAVVVVDAVGQRVPDIGETDMILPRLEQWQGGETELLGFRAAS